MLLSVCVHFLHSPRQTCQFHSPTSPDRMDWSALYPAFFVNQDVSCQKGKVEFADIGCGYGGLLGNSVNLTDSKFARRENVTESDMHSYLLCSAANMVQGHQIIFHYKISRKSSIV